MKKEYQDFYDQLKRGIQTAELEQLYEEAGGKSDNGKGLLKMEFEDEVSESRYYRKKYEAIRDSTFWRMTAPLRKAVDFYKLKRYGIQKIHFEDEIPAGKDIQAAQAGKTAIGVHLHLYYEDLLDEFCDYFEHIPETFDLYISCKEGADAEAIRRRAHQVRNVGQVVVRETPNRGRDIAPFYVLFRKELMKYEIVLHVHSKKSLYTGEEKVDWRHEAMDGVLKNEAMVSETLRLLRAKQSKVGLVFGEMTDQLPPSALHWLYNGEKGSQLLNRMHMPFENHMLFYPVGSFFWAKTEAIRPLFDLKLKYDDFEEEKGQIDGTLAHALERVISCVVKNRGYSMYIYDAQEDFYSLDKSYKCFRDYFALNTQNITELIKKEYDVVTFDIFDTLITRLVYQPDDVFRLMERKIACRYGIKVDYLSLRKEAERMAWQEKGDYCNIHHIYEKLPQVSAFCAEQAEELKQMEIDLEYELCIPRKDVRTLFCSLVAAGKKIMLISDMYLPSSVITHMLEKCGYQGYEELWVSCEKGKRKDRNTLWDEFFEKYGKYRTIHLGDNPHSDWQMVGDRGRSVLLLLSPIEQFRFSRQYKKFLPFINGNVENSLVLGCFVNQCLYNSPFALRENGTVRLTDIDNAVQGLFAPIFLQFMSYLQGTSRKNEVLLFLSREGYFLEKLFEIYCKAFHKEERKHLYFLTSRRAASLAQIREYEDLELLFRTNYEGTMSALLRERFGLNPSKLTKNSRVKLPEEKGKVMRALLDYVPELLQEAEAERRTYLKYIEQLLGSEVDWDKITLVDVGYAGTIQYYLMKLLNRPLHGCYMVSGYTMRPEKLDGTYRSMYTFWESELFDDAQLFLEAITAAPHGQVIRFAERAETVEAILKDDTENSEKAAVMQNAVYRYVEKMGALLNEIHPRFDKKLAECMFFECLRNGVIDSELYDYFQVGDGYCVDGNLVFEGSNQKWNIVK